MKTIGLIGGLSYISTIEYYRKINQKVNDRLGKKHSAKIILNSIDFQEIKKHDYKNWDKVGDILMEAILKLDSCGVDCILLCNNTQHKAYNRIEPHLDIKTPFFHIVDCLGEFAVSKRFKKLLLLGTCITMEDGFYSERLSQKFSLNIIIPNEKERIGINRIIQEELVKDKFKKISKKWLLELIDKYPCDAVILGCTELPLLIRKKDCKVPLLDTVEIHCEKAVDFALTNR